LTHCVSDFGERWRRREEPAVCFLTVYRAFPAVKGSTPLFPFEIIPSRARRSVRRRSCRKRSIFRGKSPYSVGTLIALPFPRAVGRAVCARRVVHTEDRA
jgi:hypothetical protein